MYEPLVFCDVHHRVMVSVAFYRLPDSLTMLRSTRCIQANRETHHAYEDTPQALAAGSLRFRRPALRSCAELTQRSRGALRRYAEACVVAAVARVDELEPRR